MNPVVSRQALRWAALAAALAASAGCAHAGAGYDQPNEPMETSTMLQAPSATIEGEGVRLEATLQAPAGGPVQVRYRVHNTGGEDLAVFDRGNRHAVLTGRQQTGEVGEPVFREEDGAGLVLSHIAMPLPDPPPTLPPVPLAARLAPGGVLEGEFSFSPLTATPPQRVRWCLGVGAFSEESFHAPEQAGGLEVWRAPLDAAANQQLLCTPWLDVARGAFEE